MQDLITNTETGTPLAASSQSIHDLNKVPQLTKAVLRIALKIHWGELTIVLPDGQALHFKGQVPGKASTLQIKDYKCAAKLLTNGATGMGEAYMDGLWDSPNLSEMLQVVAQNAEYFREYFMGRGWGRTIGRIMHLANRNSRAGSKRNIEAHYDLGNDFYSKWLDATMTYSSAKFSDGNQSLADAQLNKYRSLAKQIGLRAEHQVLEIGCGWGGFAEFAASEIGCHVTGVTISREQLEFARKRMAAKGLTEKVDIQYKDYRDIEGEFDRVVSIEMFEAVGEEYWPSFFTKVHDVLRVGGQAGLQIITIADDYFDSYRKNADFIQRYIFPGGMLPSPSALADQVSSAGFEWKDNISFGKDYAHTLALWRDRFQGAWPDIQPLGFDERFRRMWHMYLGYCEAGFSAGTVDVTQLTLRRN